MKIMFSLVVVLALGLLALLGAQSEALRWFFGAIFPYIAFVLFVIGVTYRVIKWAKSPVPFRIPTTCGQQKSHSWIKHNKLENPSSTFWVIGRMALEVLFFRSLFRNSKAEIVDGERVVYGSTKWLWLGGMIFHWTFLIVLFRHMRFFVQDPSFLGPLEKLDGFFQFGVPVFYISSWLFVLAVTYLFIRRVIVPQVRYISLAADYFPLFLILTIGISGIWLRHFDKVDVVAVKKLTMGLVTFNPSLPVYGDVHSLFYLHLFMVCVLFAYFPFSKLMHLAGVLLSPTRNMANNNRAVRHINPWNYPVKVHTYQEYEEEFGEKMQKAGIPVEKEY
jgi:nitrate reductase gamma subunit